MLFDSNKVSIFGDFTEVSKIVEARVIKNIRESNYVVIVLLFL